jgi:hypothetical protein
MRGARRPPPPSGENEGGVNRVRHCGRIFYLVPYLFGGRRYRLPRIAMTVLWSDAFGLLQYVPTQPSIGIASQTNRGGGVRPRPCYPQHRCRCDVPLGWRNQGRGI